MHTYKLFELNLTKKTQANCTDLSHLNISTVTIHQHFKEATSDMSINTFDHIFLHISIFIHHKGKMDSEDIPSSNKNVSSYNDSKLEQRQLTQAQTNYMYK